MRKVSSKFEGSNISFGGMVASTVGLAAVAAAGADCGHWISGKISAAVEAAKATMEASKKAMGNTTH